MATLHQDLPALGRETIRTFVTDEVRRSEPVELNAHARRAAEQLRASALSPHLLAGLCRLWEFAALATIASAVLYRPLLVEAGTGAALAGVLLLSATTIAGLQLVHGYDIAMLHSRARQLGRLVACVAFAALATGLASLWILGPNAAFALRLALWFAIAAPVLGSARMVLGSRIRLWARNGTMERRAVLVGGGTAAETFIRRLESQRDSDIRICGIFDDRDDRRSPPIVAGYPKLGSIAELTEFARLARIEMLIVTLPLSAEKRILTILKDLWVLPLDIRVSALSADMRFRPRTVSYEGEVPLLDVLHRPLADWDLVAKRMLDLAVGSLALILLSPMMLATALAIKLDSPGPVFFRQKRHGYNNQIINVWKFRSLRHEMADPTARKLVTKDDPRVTRIGRFIRRTSIDELPQLFNVMTGELSLVGPRPHAVHARSSADETFTDIVEGYFGRHKVKPGITGWAQIKGWRGEIDHDMKLQKRFEHDLYYIENWSLLLDILILIRTPRSLLKSEGAY
ncbi:undecaprenyl-phosphate glucose phosphotransferase [Aureimonas pseudogalii]|uniref:Undecaprenyl-phosphate glucose phosphotransferase n=1 Tax=Aureimonas pseudogalii TaxID=1744844 RepID=A0A7W6EH15_9HYPH|nr:undecaprenyl-phosphate glucose phosphotransferase [Aureimonas pseudogalii]MBB3998248.1 Undecaprenyl-phosphate glucose phosphotransferase [Aureimonas pseudogalii]